MEKLHYAAGDTITVSFTGAPGNSTDWIGLYPTNAPSDRSWLSWQYTKGARSGQLTFKAPDQPGSYNFRLFEKDKYTLLATGPSFTIAARGSSGDSTPAAPPNSRPVDIGGTWAGSRDQRGRLNFWQNGNEFSVIMSWPTDSGNWTTLKGDGMIKVRELTFKVYRSNTSGGAASDTPYVYYLRVADDNNSITGYYTKNGVRMDREDFFYFRVK